MNDELHNPGEFFQDSEGRTGYLSEQTPEDELREAELQREANLVMEERIAELEAKRELREKEEAQKLRDGFRRANRTSLQDRLKDMG